MTPPQHKILGESSAKRSQKLIAHTKAIIDDMVEKGIPLTVERVSLNAGCSKSFIYKREKYQDKNHDFFLFSISSQIRFHILSDCSFVISGKSFSAIFASIFRTYSSVKCGYSFKRLISLY